MRARRYTPNQLRPSLLAGRPAGRRRSREAHETPEEDRQREEWRDDVKLQETALRENRCQPALLDQLAIAYLGGFSNVRGNTPLDRLQNLLGNDENLIQAVLDGFRGAIRRNDAPSAAEIIRLDAQSQRHHLVFPVMAGLEEIVRTTPTEEACLNEKQMRLALAIHYTVSLWPLYRGPEAPPADRPPNWYRSLLTSHPDVVSDVLVQFPRSKLRSGTDSVTGLNELAFSPDHAENASNSGNVAKRATAPSAWTFRQCSFW